MYLAVTTMARWTSTHLIVTLAIHVLLATQTAGQGKSFKQKIFPILNFSYFPYQFQSDGVNF